MATNKMTIPHILCTTTLLIITTMAQQQQQQLQRAKRIVPDTDSNHSPSSSILLSPFQPPDEQGNTINYQANHINSQSNGDTDPDIPRKSPFSPPGSYSIQQPQIVLKVTSNSDRPTQLKQTRRDTQIKRKGAKPRKPTLPVQSALPSSPNTSTNIRVQAPSHVISQHPWTSHDENSRSPFNPRQDSINLDTGHGKPSVQLEMIMERQRNNTQAIPAIADIKVAPRHHKKQQQPPPPPQQQQQQRKERKNSSSKPLLHRPRTEAFQNRGNARRDMHDVGPGVTPWTRYTDRPRNGGLARRVNNASSYRGRCGRIQYSPRTQICCQGRVLRRQGIQPSCCHSNTYDAVYKKCCGREIVMLTEQRPGC